MTKREYHRKYTREWRKRNRFYHRNWQRAKRGNFDIEGQERAFILGVHVRTNLMEWLLRPIAEL